MKFKRFFLFLIALLVTSLACSLFGGGNSVSEVSPPSVSDSSPTEAVQPEIESSSDSGKFETEFPIPPKVENLMNLGDDAVNYQTPMKLIDVVDFYRDEFERTGYDERDITTVINDTTFSIVWDGHPSGKAIVVQGVDLGNGMVNVNVRFEDV